jgi:hypothetical protein
MMPVQNAIPTGYSIGGTPLVANYWVIDQISNDITAKNVQIHLSGWSEKADYDAGSLPIPGASLVVNFGGDLYPTATDVISIENLLITCSAYAGIWGKSQIV